jgi:hypothetical protein
MKGAQKTSDSDLLKLSSIIGIAGGLLAASLYYLYQRRAALSNQDGLKILHQELLKELKKQPIDQPKDADYTFSRDFMVYLYKVLYTYQTIA